MIRDVQISDAGAICRIYNKYITETIITFEEIPLDPEEVERRIKEVTQNYPWLVNEKDGKIIGYSYASKWKERSAYRYSVEAAIYIDAEFLGKGTGSLLLKELISELKNRNIHSIISGIALPNPASVGLFEKFGFEKIGQFREVGFKLKKWVDVGYWELIL